MGSVVLRVALAVRVSFGVRGTLAEGHRARLRAAAGVFCARVRNACIWCIDRGNVPDSASRARVTSPSSGARANASSGVARTSVRTSSRASLSRRALRVIVEIRRAALAVVALYIGHARALRACSCHAASSEGLRALRVDASARVRGTLVQNTGAWGIRRRNVTVRGVATVAGSTSVSYGAIASASSGPASSVGASGREV